MKPLARMRMLKGRILRDRNEIACTVDRASPENDLLGGVAMNIVRLQASITEMQQLMDRAGTTWDRVPDPISHKPNKGQQR
jgi:hypothetical protein